ncbi:hypothetical protein A2331_00275 [Candidatus Falkowbacteria bacterium RIFOXYB2_FULL_34_18]|uniref:TrbC/VIRB2 family protein n=1 Tax=Candidatus Falkowbacteria bacterium RIFOXYD2_FULL_34_120 TaxID=1798007 RepID=A0A1F5TNZ5_9BACT|nr:MAG: hypothetical protein A2331_00275 [Candidatus Falkowbacteria bacterium RIFOXYB2_FULL_34_18]OGF29018.1 MAG: hypothetical protein A2500_02690 [Candidatus Falkowbacteria bacterium RIFOXYC12_FULL_34_55]OGF35965.1 MAG: hypothetical protein A2466_01635 [Candidatus Falkowbacteria bacterium RIFOXYC2_FULL_34_220]OGF38511.1 MAG: hypothetical protein A2515_07160 [Candidatus Falkowbacteria bacterium RIFOXYD12_FULL_34_57]OGF40673.1 MAG: hypothetical protein A2531_03380 [Candidatus Falkowbacteria bact
MNSKKIFILFLSILFLNLIFTNQCLAADSLLGNISCIKGGGCTLEDVRNVIINLAGIILAITGSLALLAFVIGGVMFLVSSGSSETVTQAKRVITGAVIGMVVVFTSYTIIMFILKIFGISKIGVWQ